MADPSQKPWKIVTIVIALSPLFLWLLLHSLNPDYMIALLEWRQPYLVPNLPLGWAMTAIILILVTAASLLYWFIGQKMRLSFGTGLLQVAVFILFVVPAYLILLLGPVLLHDIHIDPL